TPERSSRLPITTSLPAARTLEAKAAARMTAASLSRSKLIAIPPPDATRLMLDEAVRTSDVTPGVTLTPPAPTPPHPPPGSNNASARMLVSQRLTAAAPEVSRCAVLRAQTCPLQGQRQ